MFVAITEGLEETLEYMEFEDYLRMKRKKKKNGGGRRHGQNYNFST